LRLEQKTDLSLRAFLEPVTRGPKRITPRPPRPPKVPRIPVTRIPFVIPRFKLEPLVGRKKKRKVKKPKRRLGFVESVVGGFKGLTAPRKKLEMEVLTGLEVRKIPV